MTKQIIYADDARTKILKWIEIVAKTVSVTIWPKWRNVILEKEFQIPQITNDGVTIAREIVLEDKYENMWAELVKEAAEKTNTIAWDGTTTATILTYALAKEWLRYIKSWVNAVELKNGMKKAVSLISEELASNTKIISTKEEIAQVATISGKDEIVWEIIAEAMSKVWNDWVISVEEWQTFWLEVEITEWMEFENWYLSPYMVDDTEKMLAEIKNVPILMTDQKISNIKDLLPLLEKLVETGKKELVIISEDIEWEALTTIILNKLKWILNILAVKAPWFGDRKKEILKDIAILTWANIITSELWMKLENTILEDLWNAKNFISSKDKTTIISGWWNKEKIDSRIKEIIKEIDVSESKYDKEKLAERLAKLSWWVAVIKVGAASEIEVKERKLRIEDALNATKAAVSEWVVAWGWVALLKASKVLENIDFGNDDQNIWASIVKQALFYPIRQIVENSWKEWAIIISKIIENNNINYGYDAANSIFVDMIEKWIIDPKKVERVALEEAVSLAWMFLTTEAAIINTAKKCDNCCKSWWWMPNIWGMWWMWGMPMM